MALCGLWHSPNPGWVLWGVAHGAGLSVHQAWTVWLRKRFALKKRLAKSVPVRVASRLIEPIPPSSQEIIGTWPRSPAAIRERLSEVFLTTTVSGAPNASQPAIFFLINSAVPPCLT